MDRIRNCIVSECQRSSGATNVTVKLCDLMIKMTFCLAGWGSVDWLLHVVISMGPQLLLERMLGWVHCVLGWDTQVSARCHCLCMFGLVHRSYRVGRQVHTTNPASCEIISLL